jgi:YbbR domain-containing protein
VTAVRSWVLEHWRLKLAAVVFAVGLWLFVGTEDRGEAVFTVPIDFTEQPANVEVTSVAVETVIVRVEGRRSLLRHLTEDDFHAAVSLKSARPGRFVARLEEEDVTAPPGVRIIRVTPAEIRAVLSVR